MNVHRLWLTLPLFAACAIDETPVLDEAAQDIHGELSAPASQFQLDRAVKNSKCTATKISAHWAVTASHCESNDTQQVRFYTTGPGWSPATLADIVAVHVRPGVDPPNCHHTDDDECADTNGDFADIALLELAGNSGGDELDLEGHQATLAWTYPGYGYDGVKVGAGNHNGSSNSDGTLLQYPDETTSDDDDDGRFDSRDETTDPADSGGPFYYGGRIMGTLFGSTHSGVSNYDVYTSIPHHLNWILSTIGYKWRGLPAVSNTRYTGTILQSLSVAERVCQYACEKTSTCEAYNFLTTVPLGQANCSLYGDITGAVTSTGWQGALKHGARTGNANDVVGFVRNDNVNSVIHKATNGNLHELTLSGSAWGVTDINPNAIVSSGLTAFRRETVDAIAFRSSTNHIIQLLRNGTSWANEADLTDVTDAPLAAGNPMAYVRADGVTAIVYRSQAGHIIELRRGSLDWIMTDLTTGSGVDAASDPVATVRSDGFSSVVFRSTSGHVYELSRPVGGDWNLIAPSALAGAPTPIDRPFAYTERDGTNSIVYRVSGGYLMKLTRSSSGQWSWQQIGYGASGSPVAYVRADGGTAVMFRNTSNHLVQVTAATTDLTTLTGAPNSATSPAVYVRSDGYNSVLFGTTANHVHEIYVKRGGTWAAGDISAVANETP